MPSAMLEKLIFIHISGNLLYLSKFKNKCDIAIIVQFGNLWKKVVNHVPTVSAFSLQNKVTSNNRKQRKKRAHVHFPRDFMKLSFAVLIGI